MALLASGGLTGAWRAARLCTAEYRASAGTEAGLRAAAASAPGNAEYSEEAAGMLADSGRRGEANAYWEQALRANPRSTPALLGLAAEAEIQGRLAEAESYLLAAARGDKGYDPRWALLNFYFRRGRWGEFWRWAPEACAMAYGDRRPLFDLYWNSGAAPGTVFERGVAGAGRPAARAYVHYLIGRGEIDAAGTAADLLMKSAEEDDAGALRAYGEGLLRAGRGQRATAVWKELARRGLAGGENLGFGWRVRAVEGAPVMADGAGDEMRVTFSGRQPERCEPLWRYAAMAPGGRYRLRFRYRTEGIEAGAGLRMTFGEDAAADLGSEEWAEGRMEVEAGEAEMGQAALRYRRAPGHTRIEGAAWIRDFRWERIR